MGSTKNIKRGKRDEEKGEAGWMELSVEKKGGRETGREREGKTSPPLLLSPPCEDVSVEQR